MKIIIKKSTENGEFFFFFQAKNGKNMGKETYTGRAGAVKAINSIVEAVQKNDYKIVDESKKRP